MNDEARKITDRMSAYSHDLQTEVARVANSSTFNTRMTYESITMKADALRSEANTLLKLASSKRHALIRNSSDPLEN